MPRGRRLRVMIFSRAARSPSVPRTPHRRLRWAPVSGDGLPARSLAGDFPINSSSTAYKDDRHPNSIQDYSLDKSVPAS